ncbi:MAG TPA: hypothetical protein VIV57_01320 [Anaeromyxobacter sp.]
MKIWIAAALAAALALSAAGCVVHSPRSSSRSASAAKKCPPGHQWSDGRCHATGKGHDR